MTRDVRMGISDAEFTRRKAYLALGEREAELLRAMLPEAQAVRESYVEQLCGELEQFEQTRAALTKSGLSRDDWRQVHADQLIELLSGEYDPEYARRRQRIGEAHQRVGLTPEWHIGAYRTVLGAVLPAAWRSCGGRADAFMPTVEALFKVILLDIDLTIGAYFQADHEKLRLFARVFESDLEAVLITDTAAGILHASHMTESISGYAPSDLNGHTAAMLLSPRNRLGFDDIWREVELDGDWQGNVWHRHANGADYLAHMSIAAVRSDDVVTHYVIEYSDATEAWQAEQSLKARSEELARSNSELEQFAYVASHDLQEPLRMVASYTQLLARRYKGRLDEDADEFIGFAVDGATRMQALINDLLKLSRVGTRGLPFAATDVGKVLDAALANLEVAIVESGAVVMRDALPVIRADETQLIQLLQNLVGNALKFRRRDVKPAIYVGARRLGATWEFFVRDNGIGISPEYFERIFIIFQRLHGKTEYAGTGIGLALCKKIVERHGGRIWVESREGEGATFLFTLPDRAAGHAQ